MKLEAVLKIDFDRMAHSVSPQSHPNVCGYKKSLIGAKKKNPSHDYIIYCRRSSGVLKNKKRGTQTSLTSS